MSYVIIGNSASGISAVTAIRECDKDGKITVISDEPHLNYSRPLISYLLSKKVTLDEMFYRGEDFYRGNKVTLILNSKVTKLNLRKKEVILADNQKIHFDSLLIAAGGVPVIPEIKGLNSEGVFTFTTLADAQNIENYIKTNGVKKALVIGGGLIGLKATEALIELKIKVTIVELADRVLSATFDKKASSIIEDVLRKNGCKIAVNNTVMEIMSVDSSKKSTAVKVREVLLKDGKISG